MAVSLEKSMLNTWPWITNSSLEGTSRYEGKKRKIGQDYEKTLYRRGNGNIQWIYENMFKLSRH